MCAGICDWANYNGKHHQQKKRIQIFNIISPEIVYLAINKTPPNVSDVI